MILVTLTGGLGNQMFQYAAGRALALRHGTCLKLDLSRYSAIPAGDTPREYQLHLFRIAAEPASAAELTRVAEPGSRAHALLRPLRRLLPRAGLHPVTLYREKRGGCNKAFFSLPDDHCLCGFWQSERYFQQIAEVIRSEFQPVRELDPKNRELASRISGTDSVSLHVRRGDYVSDPRTQLHHGNCGMAYYERCIAEIGKRVSSPHFFLFSDDPQWVRDHLKLPFPSTVVDHNGGDAAVFDIMLMSLCRHNIIANSSFSWWGGWLNRNPGKTVLAPARWFSSLEAPDLLPESWIKI